MKDKTTLQVIFDLDGTLIDSAPDLHAAVNRMLGDLGLAPLSLPEVRRMVGDGAGALISRVLAARGVDPALQPQALRAFLSCYAEDPVKHTKVYPGVREALVRLGEAGLGLSLCTNKPEAPTREVLKRLELASHFVQVVGGDTFPFRKPDPRVLQHLLGDTPAQQAVLVGDSEVDAATASAAGMPFVLVSYGYHRSALAEISRDALLDDLMGLPELLGC